MQTTEALGRLLDYEGRLMRKIESVPGFRRIDAQIVLPGYVSLYRETQLVTNPNGSGQTSVRKSDGAFLYIGGVVNGYSRSEMDAGFMRNVNSNTGQLNPH